jgi:hypothetical protein
MKSTGRLGPPLVPQGDATKNDSSMFHCSIGLLRNGQCFLACPFGIGTLNWGTYQHINISITGFWGVCWVCYPILGHLWHPKWRRHGRRAYLTSRRLDDSPGAAFGGTGWLSCYRDGNDIGDSQKDQEWWIQPADMVNCYISIYIYINPNKE